jgi:phosphoglycerate dehydrogenase-like enzyme
MNRSSGAPLTVVTDFEFDPPDQERLSRALAHDRLVLVADRGELRAALQGNPGANVLSTFRPPDDLRALAPAVRWVQLPSAGADNAVRAGLIVPDSGVVVTTANGIHAIPIAEYVYSSMLLYVRQWPSFLALQRARTWEQHGAQHEPARELYGATLGIVGLGHIGRRVARLGHAFGMRVLGLRRSTQEGAADDDVAELFPLARLHDLLRASDFVVIAVPRTPATHHLIGAPELRAMRPTAYLVNIARGDVVDEAALIQALTEGWIGGAGLDVTEREPLDPASPLWAMPNVIISPHISGVTDRYSARFTDLFIENLERFQAGAPLRNVVDPARGY